MELVLLGRHHRAAVTRLRLVPGHPVVPQPLVTLRAKHGMRMTVRNAMTGECPDSAMRRDGARLRRPGAQRGLLRRSSTAPRRWYSSDRLVALDAGEGTVLLLFQTRRCRQSGGDAGRPGAGARRRRPRASARSRSTPPIIAGWEARLAELGIAVESRVTLGTRRLQPLLPRSRQPLGRARVARRSGPTTRARRSKV